MNKELSSFAARLRAMISRGDLPASDQAFSSLALELFALQFASNPAYKRICEARQLTPTTVEHRTKIPSVPTSAFKELDLSCIPPDQRTDVFHSSGTTEQKPSRHFHCAESLALYETSLWQWFQSNVSTENEFISLTPDQKAVPSSSLVHMFETVQRKATHVGGHTPHLSFYGSVIADGSWAIRFDDVINVCKSASVANQPLTILGTAFSFVHLLDYLAEAKLRFDLPVGSKVMETGGYKNRSRVLPKTELHALITQHLGVPRENIICEYGMSELSSQAYDNVSHLKDVRHFHFPPWARVQILSPETGREVAEGETGLIRIFDLANAFSVVAIQTEDLGVRRGTGFELLGRAQAAEPRGCSLMTAS